MSLRSNMLYLILMIVLVLGTACVNQENINAESEPDELIADTEVEETVSVEPTVMEEDSDSTDYDKSGEEEISTMVLTIGGNVLTATLEENSSAAALVKLLEEGPITISMRDYAKIEKVGSIGTVLPTNNQQITT